MLHRGLAQTLHGIGFVYYDKHRCSKYSFPKTNAMRHSRRVGIRSMPSLCRMPSSVSDFVSHHIFIISTGIWRLLTGSNLQTPPARLEILTATHPRKPTSLGLNCMDNILFVVLSTRVYTVVPAKRRLKRSVRLLCTLRGHSYVVKN